MNTVIGTGTPRTRLQIGELLGGETNSTRKQMQDVIQFETKLARIMTSPENRRDKEKLYNLMSLNELQRKAPFVSTQVEPRESVMVLMVRVFHL